MGAEAFRQRIKEAKNSFLFEVDVLRRGYEMDDPEQKTRFYQETARKLLQFGEALERENYLPGSGQGADDSGRGAERPGKPHGACPWGLRQVKA